MLVLIVQTGKFQGKRVKLAGAEIVVGRDETAAVRIASAEVSRQHCALLPQGNQVLVRDLGSSNGTYVDGIPVDGERMLSLGGVLSVGPMAFKLELYAPPPMAVPTPVPPATAPVRTAVAALKIQRPTPAEKLSDDDIASWLSHGDGDSAELNTTDTAILSSGSPHLAAPETVPPIPTPAPIPPRKREFGSLAEEAADIIQRHFEMLRAQEGKDA